MERRSITESDKDVLEEWFQVRPKSFAELEQFISHLQNDYSHDYGTICHAVAAAAQASAWLMDAGPQGGITGFQAGAVMWTFIQNWMSMKGPLKLVKYENMLYPQYDAHFEKTIGSGTWKWLQEEASKRLAEKSPMGPFVKEHMESIVAGKVPFGYEVSDDI